MGIEVRNITKTFGAFTALRDVSLSVATGELVALARAVRFGKNDAAANHRGLEEPDAGSGAICSTRKTSRGGTSAAGRSGSFFQHYALFRHMTVFENVAFGLRVRRGGRGPDEISSISKSCGC